MRNILLSFYCGLMILMLITGCDKNEILLHSDGKVELYLIESFSRIENSFQIDENSVVLSDTPFVHYEDFVSYDPKEYIFELSKSVIESIEKQENIVDGLAFAAFAIKANDALIYTGYFWPGYSSTSCDCIYIDPIMLKINSSLRVNLGYPGLIQGQFIEDNRNDERLIKIFKRDKKLK